MNFKSLLLPVAATLIALVLYDMFIKKAILKSSFESDFEDDEE